MDVMSSSRTYARTHEQRGDPGGGYGGVSDGGMSEGGFFWSTAGLMYCVLLERRAYGRDSGCDLDPGCGFGTKARLMGLGVAPGGLVVEPSGIDVRERRV